MNHGKAQVLNFGIQEYANLLRDTNRKKMLIWVSSAAAGFSQKWNFWKSVLSVSCTRNYSGVQSYSL